MSKFKTLEYLLLILASSQDLNYVNKHVLKTKSDTLERLSRLLKDIELKLASRKPKSEKDKNGNDGLRNLASVVIKSIRNYIRVFLTVYISTRVLSKRVFFELPISAHNEFKFANSLGLLLSLNPVFKELASILNKGSNRNNIILSSLIPNLLTTGISFVKYPDHPVLQKHYLSIYSLLLFLEHGFKLLENVKSIGFLRNLKISEHSIWKNKSWILFPICYAKIFKYFILENESCPKYFLRSLDYLSKGLFSTDRYSVQTLIKYKDSINLEDISPISLSHFMEKYLPEKISLLFKIFFPLTLYYNSKSFERPIDIINESLKESFKAILSILFLVSSSIYSSYFLLDKSFQRKYLNKKFLLSSIRLPKSLKLQIVGFTAGLVTYLFKSKKVEFNEKTSTYRSIWLYILRLTLISSTAKHSQNNRSKFNVYKIDKLLMILSLAGLLTIKDIYRSQSTDLSDTSLNNQTSLKLLLKYINSGSLLLA